MNANRPGFLTSEFWVTLAAQVIALLVLVGLVPANDQASLGGSVTAAVEAAFALAGAALAVAQYVRGRVQLKAAAQKTPATPIGFRTPPAE